MTITEGQAELNGLVMGLGTDYHILSTDIFSWPTNRAVRSDEPNLSGWRFEPLDLFSGRSIEIEMIIKATDQTLPEAMRALSTAGLILTPDQVIPLDVFLPHDDSAKRAIGRVRNLSFPGYDRATYSSSTRCLLQFETKLPTLLSVSETVETAVLQTGSSGYTFPKTFNYSFGGGGIGGIVSVVNNGNYPYSPMMRIDGPVINPQIYHQEEDKFLKMNITLTDTDYLEIDVRESTIRLNGTASRRNTLTNTSRWFNINPLPNTNTLTFTADTYEADAQLTVTSYDAYLV